MTDPNAKADLLNWQDEPKKLPDMLNVLTILTFIACGLFSLSACYSFFTARTSYEKLVQMQSKLDDAPAFAKKFMGPEMVEMSRKSLENRVPILLLALISFGLCAYGAIQMRGFKKAGFPIYVLGELLPIVSSFLFVGLGALGGFGILFSFLFPVLFIILYWTQLKYLR